MRIPFRDNKNVQVGIIAVALGGALLINLLHGLGQESIPDTDESKTLWKCEACAHRFELTARQAVRAEESSGGVPIQCPHCNKIKAYQLIACSRCRTLFFGSEVPDESGQCPKCHPPKPPPKQPPPSATTKPAGKAAHKPNKKKDKPTSQPAKPPKRPRPKSY